MRHDDGGSLFPATTVQTMPASAPFISFPPGYLGTQSAKFPLLVDDARHFAINKPAGIACYQHDWTLGRPDLSMALRRELLNQKPQLAKLGIAGLFRAFNLDAELSGALVFAKTEAVETVLKNAEGSGQLRFRFHLLVATDREERELFCDLPLARHFTEKCMLVSHKTGKKSETRFRYLRHFGRYQLWEADSRELRVHQLRVHAAEMGLRIVGESRYASERPVYLSSIKRGYDPAGDREQPIYDGLCAHLIEVAFDIPGESFAPVQAPLPSRFATLLKRLDALRGAGGR